MVPVAGLEPTTPSSEDWCSIQLSYTGIWLHYTIFYLSVLVVYNAFMSFKDDDDDLLPSYSKQEAFTRSDHGETEELRRKIKQTKGKEIDVNKVEAKAKSEVRLQRLKQDLAGEMDEEQKRREKDAEEAERKEHQSFHTKTLPEEQEELIESGQDKPDADTLIERAEQQEDISDEETMQQAG